MSTSTVSKVVGTGGGSTIADNIVNGKTESFDDFQTSISGAGLAYSLYSNGGSASRHSPAPGEENRCGIYKATIGGGVGTYSGIIGNDAAYFLGDGAIDVGGAFKVSVVPDGVDNYIYYAGLANTISASPTYYVGLKIDYTISDTYWILSSDDNSTPVDTVSTIPFTADWFNWRVKINTAGTSAEMFIDGVSAGTITGNFPTGSGRDMGYVSYLWKTLGTTANTHYVDWCYQAFTPGTARGAF